MIGPYPKSMSNMSKMAEKELNTPDGAGKTPEEEEMLKAQKDRLVDGAKELLEMGAFD